MTDEARIELEAIHEHISDAWRAEPEYSEAVRAALRLNAMNQQEQHPWKPGSLEYHLQAAEDGVCRLFQHLAALSEDCDAA